MKLTFDIKNKKGGIEADAERLIEKGMDLHEKDWEQKFDKKHQAKKEIMEMQHNQKIEIEEQKKTKKNWLQKFQEERRKTKELELEEQRRREEEERLERKKVFKVKLIVSIILGIITIILFCVGSLLGSASGNPDSGWYAIATLGIFTGLAICFIWTSDDNSKKRKKK